MAFGKCESCATLREQIAAVERRAEYAESGKTLDIQLIEMMRQDYGRLEARYSELLDRYHALRVQGANPADERKGLAPAEASRKPADEAIETLMARWGNNPLLRKRLQRYVHQQRMKNVDEADIAHSVLHWSDPDAEESA